MPNQFNITNRGIFILFFAYAKSMKFVKNANSSGFGIAYTLFKLIGLATIGVCVFYASASVDAFFNFGRILMKKSVVSVIVGIIVTIVFSFGIIVSAEDVLDGTTGGGGGGSSPSGSGSVIKPSTPNDVAEYAFTADISEADSVLYMDFVAPTATTGKYMIINAYKNNSVVGRKVLPVNFTDKLVLMGCTDKPANLKINVWDSLANIKPIADYTDFDSKEENGVQTFSPTKGFPVRYPVSNSVIKGQIAFVTAIGEYEIEVLNSDGSKTIYNFADTIAVKENESVKEISDGILVDGTEKVAKSLVAEYIQNLVKAEKTTENFAKRIISYKANSAGKITEISFSAKGKDIGLSYVAETTMKEFDAETKMLGDYRLIDSAIVFHTPMDKSISEYKAYDSTIFKSGEKYEVAYLNIDERNNVGIVIITNIVAESIIGGDTLAIVTGSTITTNEEGKNVISVSFLKDKAEETLIVDANSKINDVENNMFKRGSVFDYVLNSKGEISEAVFCGLSQEDVLTWQEVKANADTIPTKKTDDTYYTYIGGYVVRKSGSTLIISNSFNATSGDKVNIPSTANIYTMDVVKSKVAPLATTIGDVVACKYYTENGYDYAEEGADTFVLIKYIDKEIVDVIAYYGFAPSTEPNDKGLL